MRYSKKAQVCVYGEGKLEGCTESCRYAVAHDAGAILMGRYEVRGQLLDCETNRASAGKRVTLIMPNRTRHRTLTSSRGTFRVVVEPSIPTKQPAFSIRVDFGRMVSTTETNDVVLYAEFTESFRRKHPGVRVERPLVAKFRGRTINRMTRLPLAGSRGSP